MSNVIIACDFKNKAELMNFLFPFEGKAEPYLKIGMEIFYQEGPSLVRELKEKGFHIFLDLKLHDIPNTVHNAMRNLASLGVDIINCHAKGGIKMMEEAKKGLEEGALDKKAPLLIAVTELTSTSDEMLKTEEHTDMSVKERVTMYIENVKKAGLKGIVCSPLEAPIAKEYGLVSVTPGIRLQGDSKDDQKRVTTPAIARELGSTYIVVGRSITKANNPLEAYLECVKEFDHE